MKYLTGFTPTVRVSGETYIVDYEIGECVYTYQRVGNRIKQDVLLLQRVEMGDVIEKIHMDSPLTSDDLTDMSMNIRNHSLKCVEDFINERGHHQPSISSTIS
jgi:hypothetical protein